MNEIDNKERRITLEKKGIREISIYELIERLSRYTNKPVRLATESDYDCYYMTYNNYEENLENNIVHIGYSQDIYLEGVQFRTVCTIREGKIEGLDLKITKDSINLSRLYIDNLLEKNKIVFKNRPNGPEMPY